MMPWEQERELRRQVEEYAAVKHTPEFAREQAREKAAAVRAIVEMGYSESRAKRAVREYAAAARDTRLGPDWPGWLDMVAHAGLVKK